MKLIFILFSQAEPLKLELVLGITVEQLGSEVERTCVVDSLDFLMG
jgi:hypothetical protein